MNTYEKHRGRGQLFPFLNSLLFPSIPYLLTSLPHYLHAAKLGEVNRSGVPHV
jgi:uncharacterized membrane protein